MRHVPTQLGVVRETLCKGKGGVDFGDGELVERHFGIYSGARVAVPVPDPAEVRTCRVLVDEKLRII
jgi:hypothetical protein